MLSQLGELKTELASVSSQNYCKLFIAIKEFANIITMQLRVSQVSGTASAKVAKIGLVRKNIARVLTVYNQLSKQKVNILKYLLSNFC